jgi:hypothetical protein
MFCTIYDFVYFYKYANKPILHILISETYVVQLSDTSYMSCWVALMGFYTPHNKVVGGYTGFTMSVRPSVDKSYVVR